MDTLTDVEPPNGSNVTKPWVPLGGNSCRGKCFLKNESRDMKQFGEEHVHARTGLCKAKDLIH